MLDERLMALALEEIQRLRTELFAARKKVDASHPRYQSLLNLKQYMILRSEDRTELQEKLFLMSLSSLGRSYAHVAASIDTLYDQLSGSLRREAITSEEMAGFHHVSIQEAIELASRNSTTLFGGRASARLSKQKTAVMVTLPSYAADHDGRLIRGLAKAGVRIFRINTAHDSIDTWQAMAEVIAAINATRDADSQVKIFVDLAGPKIRTGRILRLDLPVVIGSNKREKEVVIYPKNAMTASEGVDAITQKKVPAQICVEKRFFKKIKADGPVKVVDAIGKKALITITELTGAYAKGVIDKKVYLNRDSTLRRKHHQGTVLNCERQVDPIRLFKDDRLVITERNTPGHSAVTDMQGNVTEPALIGCSFKGVASFVNVGDKVFIDDGKIGVVVLEKRDHEIICRVTNAKVGGTLLKEEKGINFPDSHIDTSALTGTDRQNLLSVIDFADHVSISFCQRAEDVKALQELLEENGRSDIGIIAKIETKRAVANMPQILEQLLLCEKSGVMIARGDLAIEVGFKHMAYVQEKLLDICDAAHMPVIWATQVLESQMKSNLPSRAEVTDAAMSSRAECVMLNKGSFAIDTIDVLKHILHDMHLIFKKNRQLLSKETLW
ncbi:MAG: pyruvate kinase [Campylobacterota bacterium]|nr:pyruvate kinase [Campylobacterota bacterium]